MKKSITEHSLKYLENIKETHSKVKKILHPRIQMQNYFSPNKVKMSKEDIELIFKLRCKVVNIKMNMKNEYDTYECNVCYSEDESQEHIYKCAEIWKLKEEKYENIHNYEKIISGSVKEKVEVSRIFKDNMKIRDNFIIKK